MSTKTCACCKQNLTTDQFYSSKTTKDGLYRSCIKCEKERYRKRYKTGQIKEWYDQYTKNPDVITRQKLNSQKYRSKPENKEKLRKTSQQYRINNPEKILLQNAKKRAFKEGLEYNIELCDIHIPKFCPVLNIPIISSTGTGKNYSNNSPTIDRIDSSLGYTKGNICIISFRANFLKNNGSLQEHEQIVHYMKSHVKEITHVSTENTTSSG